MRRICSPLSALAKRWALWSYEPYIHHFPDDNASIARLLVRSLIPDAASGSSMEDIVLARFDYAKLDPPPDSADAFVRLRLNSTVVHVANERAAQ